MMYKYEIRTDAGYKDNTSDHYYRIKEKGNKTLKKESFTSNASSALEAEITTISTALRYAVEKDLKYIKVKTDSLQTVRLVKERSINIDRFVKKNCRGSNINVEQLKRDILYLRKLVDTVGARMIHIPRKDNVGADLGCKKQRLDRQIKAFRSRGYKRYPVLEV